MSARVDPNTFSMETALKKASQMFAYLRDKDVFVDAYRKQLAKRLLTVRLRDGGQAENDSIAMLKDRMGAAFTAKYVHIFCLARLIVISIIYILFSNTVQ